MSLTFSTIWSSSVILIRLMSRLLRVGYAAGPVMGRRDLLQQRSYLLRSAHGDTQTVLKSRSVKIAHENLSFSEGVIKSFLLLPFFFRHHKIGLRRVNVKSQ